MSQPLSLATKYEINCKGMTLINGWNKLDVVFVPKANYEEAINTKNKYNYNLEIISVDKFNDVIEYLKNYKK